MSMASPALRARALLVCLLACTIAVAPVSVPATPSDTHSSPSVAPPTAASHGADEPTPDSDRPLLTDVSLQQAQEANTLTIVSTSDERVYYNTTVSGHITAGEQADLADAKQPDTVTNTTASGSTAQRGADTFRFTGRITALRLTGGPASVSVNGHRINPAAIPATTQATTNTTAFLTIPANARETASYQQATLNIPSTLALDTQGLRGRFRQLTLDERFGATDTATARRAQLRATAARIETRIARLREREAATIAAYNNDSLSGRALLHELAVIHAAAGRLAAAADRVAARARSVPRSSINGQPAVSWAQNRRIALGPLQGPVRERVAEAMRGNNTVRTTSEIPSGLAKIGPAQSRSQSQRLAPLRVYVETSRNGVVLATVDDGQYYREVSLSGERNATGSRLSGSGDVLGRVRELYPWASNNSGHTELSGNRRGGIFRVALFHDHGSLTVFLNQSSGRVFAEHQRKTLSGVPTTTSIIATEGRLRLRVNRTRSTGPVEISLATPAGEPVDGTVTINSRVVGRTGTDGQVWAIAPQKKVTIGARANGESLRIRIPSRPRVNQSQRNGRNTD
jgi:hypothetical protein